MADIPKAVLSEHFQERLQGRRVRSAVFFTYQFDSGFFEQEVLPVLLDVPLSHAPSIRLVQLEEALRETGGHVAVYYDAGGLTTGDAGSARLDVRRIPVQHATGVFHPKNVLLLVEHNEPDAAGNCPQSLLIASLSANLTRSGWWENVECCHIEELQPGDRTRLKDDVASFLKRLRSKTAARTDHAALREMLQFLKSVQQRTRRASADALYPHFYAGREPLVDFLDRTAGDRLRGTRLEIISPYFDDAADCAPLNALINRFAPTEVRVFLPRSAAGEALVRRELFDSVRNLPSVRWGRLPKELLQLSRRDDAGQRAVHAKVYRFFTPQPKRELCFVGSANLTSPGHGAGGNVETGFLIETTPARRPDFWLTPDEREPAAFLVRGETEEAAGAGGTRLNLRYHWDEARAAAYWDGAAGSPRLRLEARGVALGDLDVLSPRQWTTLSADFSRRLEEMLHETSLVEVHGEDAGLAYLLVQEEGMSHKPSLLLQLSAADILRYWSLLTVEQRTAFLEARAPELSLHDAGGDLVTRARMIFDADTVFDRFAGFFHAFGCLERTVRTALANDQPKEATYRLFGKKYDSLGPLLDRVTTAHQQLDAVDRYVIMLCAQQLLHEVARSFPAYCQSRADDVKSLQRRFAAIAEVRAELIREQGEEFATFLPWFEQRFLKKATLTEEPA